MRNNPEGGDLDLAEGVYMRCKKNLLSVLSCTGKRTREGCVVGTGNSRRDREGERSVPPSEP